MEQHLSAAYRCLGIGSGLGQQLAADVLFGNRLALHKLVQFLQVLSRIEGDAAPFAAVSSGAARLLIVSFQRFGDVVVYHKAHVGLVDTHAKGDGGYDDVNLLHQEGILGLRSQRRLQAGMIGSGLDVVGLQDFCQFLHLLARQAVDDAALAGVLLDEADDVLVYIVRLGAHLIIQVGAVERALELLGIHDAQILLDVRAHLVCGGGGQGDDGGIAYLVDDGTDAAVFRTEVVSPLRDAVGLVYCIKRYLGLLQELYVLLLRQRLRSHIEQLGLACLDVGLYLIYRCLVKRRVQIVGSALLAHAANHVHLVLHQCNQRGDDNGCSFHQQGRKLVAQRLAAAGRHQHEGVVAVQHVLHDGFLVAFELVKAKVFLQRCCQILFFSCHRLFNDVIVCATCRVAAVHTRRSLQRI